MKTRFLITLFAAFLIAGTGNIVKAQETKMENKVFNQYQPDGYVTDAWCTNLNPQDDIWSKDISVQSDLLTLTYKDDSKLDYYGSNVKEKEKNNLWEFFP